MEMTVAAAREERRARGGADGRVAWSRAAAAAVGLSRCAASSRVRTSLPCDAPDHRHRPARGNRGHVDKEDKRGSSGTLEIFPLFFCNFFVPFCAVRIVRPKQEV